MARPTYYDPERHPKLARALARMGLTAPQLAEGLGLGQGTVKLWRRIHPEFAAAVDAGKLEADALVEDSLYKRAMGYEYEETEILATKNGNEEGKTTRIKRIKKHVAPDVTAQIFWLKNRKPSRWGDRGQMKITHEGQIDTSERPKDYSKLSIEELEVLETLLTKCSGGQEVEAGSTD